MSDRFQPIDPTTSIKPGDHWMGVTRGMSGWFAVELWMNDREKDLGPFAEPWQTGEGRYRTEAEACTEAWFLACSEDLPYSLRYTPGTPEFDTALRAIEQREGT